MRISLRLIASLVIAVSLVALFFARLQVQSEKRALRRDLERRAELLAESLSETVEPLLERGSRKALQQFLDRFGNRERLAGVAVYDGQGALYAMASGLVGQLTSVPSPVTQAVGGDVSRSEFLSIGQKPMHVYVLPLHYDHTLVGALAVLHDAAYIESQSSLLWRDTFLHVLIQALLIALISLLIIRVGIEEPLAKTARWMRELRTSGTRRKPSLPEADIFKPLVQEVTHLTRSLEAARGAAEKEARLRNAAESLWTPERLRVHVKSKLQSVPLFVVSNREPLMHVRRGKAVEAMVPASGLVTALEPIMRACHGVWVAQGAGDADRETVDAHDRIPLPPEEPQYTLRRTWLSREEEQGYYYGFANEGLWPLCHIAHTRPIFRAQDWAHYQDVNRKFAQAVLEEMKETPEAPVLVQDYHFALLPRLLKEKRPDARVAIFWHIPWPNPEAFGICPWQRELLDGLLGADLVGFHTQSHCDNFLETVDNALECRIEWERFAVARQGHVTSVRPFPISVAFPEDSHPAESSGSPYLKRAQLFRELGVAGSFLGIGVDRVDYTKGILERFRGVERFLEKCPSFQRQFTFVQIGAPSRVSIPSYRDLLIQVETEADRINRRFQTTTWRPIVLLKLHHSHEQIAPLYKAADLCMVTSLHDGMNLVAKEFVAARHDDDGVLILSRFTGASRELRDALIVNPYDTEELAEAIRQALEMDPVERRARMQRMRCLVREQNIYRWAGNLITELSAIRLEAPEASNGGGAPVGERGGGNGSMGGSSRVRERG